MAGEILVPLDGSRFAEAALPSAIRIARRDGRSITLAAVSQSFWYERWSAALDEWEFDRSAHLDDYVVATAKRLEQAAGVPVSVTLREGAPGDVLASLPAVLEAGMVVMSTHGYGPFARLWFGSVADRVVRGGGVPVLLVKPREEDVAEGTFEPAAGVRRILVPVDGSEAAESALRKSTLVGNPAGPVHIILLRVVPLPLPATSPRISDLRRQVVAAEMEEAGAYLEDLKAKLVPWGVRVTTHVVQGEGPGAEISRFAAEHAVDLIAMATHGRGEASRFVLGSVSDRVVRTASVPVLLFPPARVEVPNPVVEDLAMQIVGMP